MNTRACWIALVAAARRTLRDRNAFIFRSVFFISLLTVISALWHVATHDRTIELQGYGYVELMWYVLAAEAAVVAAPASRIEQLGDEINAGDIEDEMLRPASVLAIRVSNDVGYALVRLAGLWLVGITFMLIVVGPPPSVGALVLSLPLSILAVTCNMVAMQAFGAIAFWIHDAKSTWFLYQKLIFFVGGMIFPLAFLPGWAQTVAWFLPFWTMSHAPGNFSAGHVVWWYPVGQLAWIAAALIAAAAVFRAGQRRVQVGR